MSSPEDGIGHIMWLHGMVCPIHATPLLLRRTVPDPAPRHGLHLPSQCLAQSFCRATDPVPIVHMNHKTPSAFTSCCHLGPLLGKWGPPAGMGCALLPAITSPWHPWSLASKPLMSPCEPHTPQCPRARGQTMNKTTIISSFLCGTNSELLQQDLKELSQRARCKKTPICSYGGGAPHGIGRMTHHVHKSPGSRSCRAMAQEGSAQPPSSLSLSGLPSLCRLQGGMKINISLRRKGFEFPGARD